MANSASRSADVRIRSAHGRDAEELTRLINSAFVVERIAFDGDRVDLAQVNAYMDKGTFLVAGCEETFGCVYIELHGDRSYLGLLSVRPDRQGSGLGSRLMSAAEEYARGKGSRAMDLRVISPRAELLPFYFRLGYQRIGTAPFAPNSGCKVPGNYILMSKPLS